jgi:phosphoglycerate-specific signal transduction histidine kinase
VVPLLGLILDYVRTHQTLEKRNQEFLLEISERQKAQQELQETIQELQVTQMQLVQNREDVQFRAACCRDRP